MSELQQPGPSDAVKGGQFSPTYGAVLGGLEGAKRRLANSSDEVRIAALFEVLKYGRDGLELVVQIVKTETGAVQRAAYELLWERTSERARIKLQNYSPGKAIAQTFTQHLSQIINDNYREWLAIGKYTRWAVSLTAEQLLPMLCAIGCYGRPGLDANQRLNARQVAALLFLRRYFWLACYPAALDLADDPDALDREIANSEFSWKFPGFEENTCWADQLTPNDLFGVLWHVGGFGGREYGGEDNLNSLYYRSQECLNCLMQVAQGQQTYYYLAGTRFPLREPRAVSLWSGQSPPYI